MRRIAFGLGLNGFPFDRPADFWSWIDLCEVGGLDSIWPPDRLIGREPVAESITKLQAVCTGCGRPATRSQRFAHAQTTTQNQILVGAQDSYEARCRFCHEPEAIALEQENRREATSSAS